jgi:hypothetical protein
MQSHEIAASQVYRRKFCSLEVQLAETASDESDRKRYMKVRKIQSSDDPSAGRSNSLGIDASGSGAINYQPSD